MQRSFYFFLFFSFIPRSTPTLFDMCGVAGQVRAPKPQMLNDLWGVAGQVSLRVIQVSFTGDEGKHEGTNARHHQLMGGKKKRKGKKRKESATLPVGEPRLAAREICSQTSPTVPAKEA